MLPGALCPVELSHDLGCSRQLVRIEESQQPADDRGVVALGRIHRPAGQLMPILQPIVSTFHIRLRS